MNKSFWAIIAAIIVIFGGILLFNGKDAKAPDGASGSSSSGKPSEHLYGQGKGGVKLVEYGDYQCPYCGQFHPVINQVKQKYGEQITYQFRNLPLVTIHQNAFAAARAAEAVAKQDPDKFWQMQDLLYQNQGTWKSAGDPQAIFTQYAAQLGLDVQQFKKDVASSAINGIINADIKEFDKMKISKSTPTYILDGKRVQPTDITLEAFSKLLDPVLAEKAKNGN